jgi:hypothetical protein
MGDFRSAVTFCFFGARSLDGYGQIIASDGHASAMIDSVHAFSRMISDGNPGTH